MLSGAAAYSSTFFAVLSCAGALLTLRFGQVRARVDEVLAQVDMTERFNDLVGTPGTSGLPTEARKRLTIAVELMANPPVLFMDEPTSGMGPHAFDMHGLATAQMVCCVAPNMCFRDMPLKWHDICLLP